jgi:hypothetical protein
MILGMSLSTFTLVHVGLSLIAIAAGIVVVAGMLQSKPLQGWTALFLVMSVVTIVTGFLFPFAGLLPSHIVGVISTGVLAITLLALYGYHLAGAWRWIYVIGAIVALYLNVFVGVVQSFQKVPQLRPLAPTQTEPAFVVTQGVVLLLFVLLGALAVRRFRPGAGLTPTAVPAAASKTA